MPTPGGEQAPALLERILEANAAFLALGNERLESADAVIIRNRDIPAVRDANHIAGVRTGDVDTLLARAETEFTGFPHRQFILDPLTPREVELRLVMEGYQAWPALLMALEGPPLRPATDCDIRPPPWLDYEALLRVDATTWPAWVREAEDQLLRARQLRAQAGVEHWLAYAGGAPAAYLSSWVAPNDAGYLEDLFTHPDFRHRGLATALIHHCIAHCRERGADEIVLVADASDTPKMMYQALGFRPVALLREYWKAV